LARQVAAKQEPGSTRSPPARSVVLILVTHWSQFEEQFQLTSIGSSVGADGSSPGLGRPAGPATLLLSRWADLGIVPDHPVLTVGDDGRR
ncbi:MAG: hypothetical protein ACYCTZ_16160, partial [Candidatus Dormibacteria bacterium]